MLKEGQVRIPSGCAIAAVIDREGGRMSGRQIIEAMRPMHDRSNGLGGGFAAYGIYPEHSELYALHCFFDERATRKSCELFLKERFEIVRSEIIPTRKTAAITDSPVIWRYFAAPLRSVQDAMQLDEEIETGKTLDLSAQDNLTGLADGPQATTYTWYAEDGTTLVAGTDYTEDGGKFTFLKAQSQPVYCTMETAAFPSFSGANAFRTTAISVKGGDGVESTATATIAIRGGKGTITTDNLPVGSRVEVYDLSGRKVAGQDSAEGRATFSVKPGLYIVSVNGTARKVNAF